MRLLVSIPCMNWIRKRRLNTVFQFVPMCLACYAVQIKFPTAAETKLGVKLGQATPDGNSLLNEEECLAACSSAPMMQVNHVYHTHLTPEKVDQILDGLSKHMANQVCFTTLQFGDQAHTLESYLKIGGYQAYVLAENAARSGY